jgi:hypothetical protein
MKAEISVKYILALFLLFRGLFLYAETYSILSPEVKELRYLYGQEKQVFPFFSYPVHGSDLLAAAEKLRDRPGAGGAVLDRLIETLSRHKQGILLRGGLEAAYHHRLRTDTVLIDPGMVKNGADFRRAFFSLPPVLGLSAGGGTFTGLFLEAEVELRPAWKEDYAPDNNFFFPATTFDITFDLINKGVLSWNGKYGDVFFGRDNNHFGDTPGGSLYPSKDLPYMDGLRLFVSLGPFSMDYLLSTIQPKKAPYDVDPNDGTPEDLLTGLRSSHFGFMTDPDPTIILSVLHRFQWNFGRIKTGAGANVVYARSNNMYTITDITPLLSWHNADMRPNNMNLVIDFSWILFRGFTLTGQLGFDDINANLFGVPDSGTPTIPAAILQMEYNLRQETFAADFSLEGGYTHYLWGNFAYGTDETWGTVPLARGIYRYAPSKNAVLLPLTSPYGPGTIWGRLVSAFSLPRYHIRLSADLLVLTKNERVNLVDTVYNVNDRTHKTRRIWYASLDLPCSYTWRYLEFTLAPAVLLRNKRAAFECTLGITFRLGGEKQLIPGGGEI